MFKLFFFSLGHIQFCYKLLKRHSRKGFSRKHGNDSSWVAQKGYSCSWARSLFFKRNFSHVIVNSGYRWELCYNIQLSAPLSNLKAKSVVQSSWTVLMLETDSCLHRLSHMPEVGHCVNLNPWLIVVYNVDMLNFIGCLAFWWWHIRSFMSWFKFLCSWTVAFYFCHWVAVLVNWIIRNTIPIRPHE